MEPTTFCQLAIFPITNWLLISGYSIQDPFFKRLRFLRLLLQIKQADCHKICDLGWFPSCSDSISHALGRMQAPLYVATKLAKIRHASLTCPSAQDYAKAGLGSVGYEPRCTPYWAHAMMWWMISMVPPAFMDSIRLSQNLSIRKRALAKEASNKQQ